MRIWIALEKEGLAATDRMHIRMEVHVNKSTLGIEQE